MRKQFLRAMYRPGSSLICSAISFLIYIIRLQKWIYILSKFCRHLKEARNSDIDWKSRELVKFITSETIIYFQLANDKCIEKYWYIFILKNTTLHITLINTNVGASVHLKYPTSNSPRRDRITVLRKSSGFHWSIVYEMSMTMTKQTTWKLVKYCQKS